ncbi:Protein translocase subunit SecD [Tepidanaerobacter acetatoxydans Re1]|uniref:Protein translocase subunit SecD n=1 Tax=Tepidanaerobacter acetatoxydans (strain DSM 21804 / JCM 16047 / Re1) TaxID=1209989 RepID=F4LTJ8_TEPAE|nr:protein translocase subunit SecD [Tepidanaerobacter acetatoxydans]AEE91328.1 protein-export membrane protein SecD [Tepidanaerobacter acetatoxydans Re1]CDI40637.1 Protein translocase subunit SecD [Tepidanaerobacter acetatoxydans Re1]
MNSQTKSLIKIAAIVIVAAILAYATLYGFQIAGYKIIPIKESIKLGLDLRGGVSVLLEAKPKPGEKVTDEKMTGAENVIRSRIDQLGVTEPVIVRQGDTRILVELPGVEDSQRALEIIGKTASLQFVGPDNEVILTGDNVKDAKAVYGQQNEPMVSLKFDSEGAKKFAKATEKYLKQPIAIVLDEQLISAPTVEDVITNGEAVITNIQSIENAAELAALIRAGALPVDLEQRQVTTVGPTLGADSLNKSLKAGLIGVALVFLFMLFYYRIPGLIADFSLLVYIMLVLIIFSAIGATLTLPGIAGFILSIGMAVDANVLIFERMKEELRNGKTLRAAVDAGFHRALTTIIDSNITTIIAAVVLLYFGTGPIKGFAVTLIIGIAVSMFTAITVTRVILINLVNTRLFTNKKLFGV